ncbi:MAG: DUF3575 domain-containing protein [Tannerellaceae bacterium]|jgi:hypothetical protein|nr:DUF3575 domain-containing protein [Tannerellaceae bacterium]
MRRTLVLISVALVIFCSGKSQNIAVKSNILYDATSTLNLGLEIGLTPKWTLELPVNYNPWSFSDSSKIKHWAIQPEARYWFCEKFNGHFLGIHGLVGGYNVGGIDMFGLKEHRYEGNMYGGGLSYGYQWILNNRWSMEVTVGAGYVYLEHNKYRCGKCESKIKNPDRPADDMFTKSWIGPTKAGISIIYVIK